MIYTSCITTPVKADKLWTLLDGHMFQVYISEGFRVGFRIGASQKLVDNLKPVVKTTLGLGRCSEQLVNKLNVELKAGRVLGPYDCVPLGKLIVSPLYVIEKSTPGKYRLIHNLSFPKTLCVNNCISNNMKTVQYCSLLDVARYIHLQDTGADLYMAKMDLKYAYKCVPIHKEDWYLLGMQFQDKYFVDTCLPMGLASSCFIFNIISDAINFLATKRGCDKVFSYLDDFLIVGTTKESVEASLNLILQTCHDIGFPVSEQKTVYPKKNMIFLGLGIDCDTRSFYVPEEKRSKLIQLINSFLVAKKKLVLDFQKLLGKLNFVSTTLIPGKALMGSMFAQLRGILSSDGWKTRRVTNNIKVDLIIWRRFLQECSSKQFKFIFVDSPFQYCITTDASSTVGFGCVFGKYWFQGKWDDLWWSENNIALLELYPVYVALRLWASELSHTVVRIVTDNASVVAMLSDFYSRDRHLNTLLKECAFLVMSYNIVLQPQHIAGTLNLVADKLSRYLPCPELSMDSFVTIPDILLPHNVKKICLFNY